MSGDRKAGDGARSAGLSFGKMRNQVQVVYTFILATLFTLSAVSWYLLGRVDRVEALPSTALLVAGAVLTVITAVGAAVFPKMLLGQMRDRDVAMQLRAFITGKLLFAAGIEGAGLYWAVLAPLLDQPVCLAGPAAALLALFMQFPTVSRIETDLEMSENKIERELEKLLEGTS